MTFYSDASYSNGKAGLACIAVDDQGQVVNAVTSQCDASDVVSAELNGILECIKLVNNMDALDATLVSDCKIAVSLLHNPGKVSLKYAPLVDCINEMKGNIVFKWGSRDGNSKADALAVLASRRSELGSTNSGYFRFHV